MNKSMARQMHTQTAIAAAVTILTMGTALQAHAQQASGPQAENMHAGSLLIVSVYGDHHEAVWDALASTCDFVDQYLVENDDGVRWKVRALRPKAKA